VNKDRYRRSNDNQGRSKESNGERPKPLMSLIGTDPARILFVGDHPEYDIAGATAVGMRTVWIENPAHPLTGDIPVPDLVIPDLTQLPHANCKE